MEPQNVIQVEILNTGMTISDYVSIISVIGAWIAVIIALKNSKYMKESIKLINNQEERNKPSISIKTVKSIRYVDKEKDISLYAFQVEINNESDIPNSIKNVELKINFKHNNFDLNIVLKSVENTSLEGCTINSSQLPIAINQRQTITTWLLFEIKNSDVTELKVSTYVLHLTDTFNNIFSSEDIIILKGVENIDEVA